MAVKSMPHAATIFACIVLLATAVFTISLQIFLIVFDDTDKWSLVSPGIWAGFFGAITSVIGFMILRRPTDGGLVFFLVFSLVTFLIDIGAIVVLVLAILSYNRNWGSTETQIKFIINIVSLACTAIAMFCLLMTILISSQAFCCGKNLLGSTPSSSRRETLTFSTKPNDESERPKSILKKSSSFVDQNDISIAELSIQQLQAPGEFQKPNLKANGRDSSPQPGEYRAYLKGTSVKRTDSELRKLDRDPSLYRKSPIDMNEMLSHPINQSKKANQANSHPDAIIY